MIVRIIVILLVVGFWTLLRDHFGVAPEVVRAAQLAILMIVAIGWPIGFIVGRFLSHDADVDAKSFKIVAGVNLVAWAIPVVGIAVSTMTLQFYKRSDASKLLFWSLGAIGGWGAILYAGISGAHAMQAIQAQETRARYLEASGVIDSGERSTARCPYAAREAWSLEDIEKYCRPKA